MRHILGFAVIVLLASGSCRTITLAETNALLAKSLRRGDGEEKVRNFMAENSIRENGQVWEYSTHRFGTTHEHWPDRDKFPIAYFFDGAIDDTERSFWVTCGHYFRFYFNKDKKLEGYVVQKICTGP